MGVISVFRNTYFHQPVTFEDSREIRYGLPACIAVVSANPMLPACGEDSSALPAHPDALVLPGYRGFSGSTCR